MKKIGKFRKWLIEKLGGFVSLPQPIILEDKRQTVTLESTEILTQEQLMYSEYSPKCFKREIKQSLWQKLGEQAIPYLTILMQEKNEFKAVEYKARLTIVKELQNER